MKVELIRTAGDTPSPSHGGPALSVTWTLSINNVVIHRESARYLWAYTQTERDTLGAKPPLSMASIRDALLATVR